MGKPFGVANLVDGLCCCRPYNARKIFVKAFYSFVGSLGKKLRTLITVGAMVATKIEFALSP